MRSRLLLSMPAAAAAILALTRQGCAVACDSKGVGGAGVNEFSSCNLGTISSDCAVKGAVKLHVTTRQRKHRFWQHDSQCEAAPCRFQYLLFAFVAQLLALLLINCFCYSTQSGYVGFWRRTDSVSRYSGKLSPRLVAVLLATQQSNGLFLKRTPFLPLSVLVSIGF